MPLFNNNSGEATYTTPKRYWRTTVKDRVPVKLHLMLLLCNLLLKFVPDSVLVVNRGLTSHNGRVANLLLKANEATCPRRMTSPGANKLDQVPDVDIDPKGRFKYILIKVWDPEDEDNSKYIVRGYLRAGYHADIFDEVEPAIKKLGLKSDCTGGGRIEHNPVDKYIEVFGYSTGFGRADHEKSREILKKRYPEYKIQWSNQGY